MHSIAVHGGAGTLSPADLTPDSDRAFRAGLERALRAGHAVLVDGGTSLDAVVAAVRVLEYATERRLAEPVERGIQRAQFAGK